MPWAKLRREIVGKVVFKDLPPEILERTGSLSLTKIPGGWTIKSRSGLIYMLTNPAYIGHIYYKGRIIKKNAHDAIVDEDDFWYAYYRLATTDFGGNPIEHPEGATKRYSQVGTIPYEVLFQDLRYDGTPMITTTVSGKSGVYATRSGTHIYYHIEDRSQLVSKSCVRVRADWIDSIFSERLRYRVGEALKSSGEYPLEEEDIEELEKRRQEIHTHLVKTLEYAEQGEDSQSDPLATLRNSINETKRKIAEKVRVSEAATEEMDEEDLKNHFASLKKLRRYLAEMESKLNKAEEEAQEEAMGRMPEVYERWENMKMENKQRFIRAATERVILDPVQGGWLRLKIEWSPLMGGNLVDVAYIWTTYRRVSNREKFSN
jgi:hypothetical protein